MKIYDLYLHPTRGTVAVQRGFCWPAFMAPSVWAAARGLGALTAVWVVASTLMFDVLRTFSAWFSSPPILLLSFIAAYTSVGLRPGYEAHRWWGKQLHSDGYRLHLTVAAEDRRHALAALRPERHRPAPLVVLTYGTSPWPGSVRDCIPA